MEGHPDRKGRAIGRRPADLESRVLCKAAASHPRPSGSRKVSNRKAVNKLELRPVKPDKARRA